MKTKIDIRVMASLLVLGLLVLSAALLVSAQTGGDTNKKAKKEPPPLDTAPYEVWRMCCIYGFQGVLGCRQNAGRPANRLLQQNHKTCRLFGIP